MVPGFKEFILQYFSMHSTVLEHLLPGTVPGVKNTEMSKNMALSFKGLTI